MNPLNRVVASGTGVLIGIPSLGRPVSLEWASRYKSLHPPINYNMQVMQINGAPVADARNAIAEAALKNGARYVFFLGDDVLVPPHTLRQFITAMENNPKIGVIGGVYCSKSTPPAPLVFRGNGVGSYWDWKVGEFFEVTGLGMDCTIIRSSIFNNLSKPWFKTVRTDEFEKGTNKADEWTEDLWFLKRVVEETQLKIFCDGSIICEHEDVFANPIKRYTLPPASLPCRQATHSKKLRTIDIGCGPIRRQIEDTVPIRVDIREDCEPDYRCDVRTLPFDDGSFDVVFSSHVLEHFPRNQWKNVLMEWCRIVSDEGKISLVLPNIKWAASRIVNDHILDNDVLNVLYGAQSYEYDFHYNGLTPERMEEALMENNFEITSLHEEGYNMFIEAKRQCQNNMQT